MTPNAVVKQPSKGKYKYTRASIDHNCKMIKIKIKVARFLKVLRKNNKRKKKIVRSALSLRTGRGSGMIRSQIDP